ncbi:MAG: histidine phosphatase family protein [Bacteroidetes bacterium]|nr:histidine phosphatase family protein [Bacteroidota bacterium]
MKSLVILRHAKAEKNELLEDFERGLTDKGKLEASEMGKKLAKKNFKPDLIIASPAKRTNKTSKIIASELKYIEKKIEFNSTIYLSNVSDLLHLIRDFDESFSNIIIVGHNPAVTSIIGYLTPNFIEHLPTAGFAYIEFDVKSWKLINQLSGKLLSVEFPTN